MPDAIEHPGVYWREIIEEQERTVRDVADQMGVSASYLSQVLTCKQVPSAAATVRFARVTRSSPRLLWHLCADYQLDLALGKQKMRATP